MGAGGKFRDVGYIRLYRQDSILRFVFSQFFTINNMARFVFRFVFGLFFPQERVFNNFSALFFGLFRFVFRVLACVFNNFSGLFLKKGILFYFFDPKKPEN
jgi:hypothetical protein